MKIADQFRNNDNTTQRVVEVRIESAHQEHDAGPEHLGTFTSEWSEGCIDRDAEGVMKHSETRYWKPGSNHFPHNPKAWASVSDEARAETIKKYGSLEAADTAYVRQDWKRHEAYGETWHELGIWCEALVIIEGIHTAQKLRSGGLWGIESDSDPDYFRDVALDEITQLREIVIAMGFTAEQFDDGFMNEERGGLSLTPREMNAGEWIAEAGE